MALASQKTPPETSRQMIRQPLHHPTAQTTSNPTMSKTSQIRRPIQDHQTTTLTALQTIRKRPRPRPIATHSLHQRTNHHHSPGAVALRSVSTGVPMLRPFRIEHKQTVKSTLAVTAAVHHTSSARSSRRVSEPGESRVSTVRNYALRAVSSTKPHARALRDQIKAVSLQATATASKTTNQKTDLDPPTVSKQSGSSWTSICDGLIHRLPFLLTAQCLAMGHTDASRRANSTSTISHPSSSESRPLRSKRSVRHSSMCLLQKTEQVTVRPRRSSASSCSQPLILDI